MATVHHFGDFSGRGDFGLGVIAERFRTAFRCENHCSFSIGCHRDVSWEGGRWWWMPSVRGCGDSACLLRMWQESFPESVPRKGFDGN
jgi:hypothetical protein